MCLKKSKHHLSEHDVSLPPPMNTVCLLSSSKHADKNPAKCTRRRWPKRPLFPRFRVVRGKRAGETLRVRSMATHLVLLYLLFEGDGPFLVLAPFVLEPHAYDARAQTGHFDQLFLHEGVRPRVGRVARPQRVQLLLVEHGPDARRLPVRRALARRAQPAAAVARPVRPRPA